MSLLARDLFILMDSAIIWIYFRNSPATNFFNSCFFPVQGHVGHYTNKFIETDLDFFIKYPLRGHLMWILLPRRHLLFLLSSAILLYYLVVVVVVVVVMVVVVIVQVAVVVVVKSWPDLVNKKLEARASKYKFGPRVAKHKFGARVGKHIFGARADKCKSGGRVGKYKLGARAKAWG